MGASGAVVVGKRMFDNAHGWGDEPPFHKPVFVLTHTAREPLTKGDTTFTFVTEGIESAVEQAKAAAGDEDVAHRRRREHRAAGPEGRPGGRGAADLRADPARAAVCASSTASGPTTSSSR